MPDTPENRARVPAGLQPGARDELRPRADRGDHLAVVRGDPRPGRLPLRRQGPGRGQPAAAAVGRAPPRRRAAGGPPDVGLGRHVPAQAARASTPSAACRRTAGPTSARGPAWARTTTWSSGRSRRRSARWTGETYNALPDSITVREVRFRVEQPGFRTRSVVVVTTLLDPEQASREELASLYRARWNNELDLRSIKVTLQMDMLRCKTPELVRKEIWTHVLAYNLIRTVMAQAAAGEGVRAAVDQLQGDAPGAGGVPAADRLPGRTAARATGRRSTSSCSGPSPCTASPTGPTGSSPAWPRRGPGGTTEPEEAAEGDQTPDAQTS